MKKEINNHESLLKKLVLEGDAHAFFSLTRSYFQARYLRTRSGGAPEADATQQVLAEAIDLLEQVQQVSHGHLDAWLEEHCTLTAGTGGGDEPEVLIDAKIVAETDNFLAGCSRELLRTGSDIKRSTARSGKKFPQNIFRNKKMVAGLVVLVFLMALTGSTLLMIKFNLAVEVHFLSRGEPVVLRFPPISRVDSDSSVAFLPVVPQVSDSGSINDSSVTQTADTLSSDTIAPNKINVESTAAAVTRTRSLPPVVPKARLISPPPPPPPPEPVQPQAEPSFPEVSPEPVPQSIPSVPESQLNTESGDTY
jgi:hypothetical protein